MLPWERMFRATNYLNWYLWIWPTNLYQMGHKEHFEKWEREHDPKQMKDLAYHFEV